MAGRHRAAVPVPRLQPEATGSVSCHSRVAGALTLQKHSGGSTNHEEQKMRRLTAGVSSLVLLLFFSAGPLSAEDGATLYKQICATCHEAGVERAPNRQALRAMSP